MSEKKYPIKWEYKSHSHQIADTGDYDGYWEITNGKDSLITKEDYEDIEKDLQAVVDLLNTTYANFTFDRGVEAALNAENEWLKNELEQARQQHPKGAVWVKASIVKVLEWAEKFHSENGDQLMLDDNEWYVTMEDEDEFGIRNCKSVTSDDLAELYLMHHPDESPAEQPVVANVDFGVDKWEQWRAWFSIGVQKFHLQDAEDKAHAEWYEKMLRIAFAGLTKAAEQPGREVDDLKTFLHWLTRDSFLELIGGQWTAKNDEYGTCPFSQERIIEMFKDQ